MTYSFPGFIDVHVHFRDFPENGIAVSKAAGFACVVTMPNTTPACDSVEEVKRYLNLPGSNIIPSACITKGRLGHEVADLEALAAAGCAFFTDDGAYVADTLVMREAMKCAASLKMCICEHAMDPALLKGGVIRDCPLARKLNLPTISVEVETEAIKRDLALCRETGCQLHIQHISTAAGVELVRDAQKEGLPVSAEATPHHLYFSCDDLSVDDASYKMAPPLGNHEDRAELRKAVREGALMFATDHAPHPADKKDKGFLGSANGIIGLEAALGITHRVMVEEEGMSLEKWAEAWYLMPRKIIHPAVSFDFDALPKTEFEIVEPFKIDTSAWKSRTKNSPYNGLTINLKI